MRVELIMMLRLGYLYCFALVLLVQVAQADTEIRNFKLPLSTPTLFLGPEAPVLQYVPQSTRSKQIEADMEAWIAQLESSCSMCLISIQRYSSSLVYRRNMKIGQ